MRTLGKHEEFKFSMPHLNYFLFEIVMSLIQSLFHFGDLVMAGFTENIN